MTAPAVRSPELAFAAYGLALRITRDEEQALATLESVSRHSPEADGAVFLRRVRRAARYRRAASPDPATAPQAAGARPTCRTRSGGCSSASRCAGMTVTEAAAALGIDRREALRLLHRGLLAAGGCLAGRAGRRATTRRPLGLDGSRRRSRRRRPARSGGRSSARARCRSRTRVLSRRGRSARTRAAAARRPCPARRPRRRPRPRRPRAGRRS